uniref:rhodanese-like domain-containing protein n=1 Tax=Alistipes sp. TaxID=1872444 RepID=UPI004056B826
MMLAFFVAALWTSCNDNPGYNSVDVETFTKAITDPNVQLIDTRTPQEFAAGHIPGAINIDINNSNFDTEAKRLVKRDLPIALYCRSGRRSKIAAERLLSIGYNNIMELNSGFITWRGEVELGKQK